MTKTPMTIALAIGLALVATGTSAGQAHSEAKDFIETLEVFEAEGVELAPGWLQILHIPDLAAREIFVDKLLLTDKGSRIIKACDRKNFSRERCISALQQ